MDRPRARAVVLVALLAVAPLALALAGALPGLSSLASLVGGGAEARGDAPPFVSVATPSGLGVRSSFTVEGVASDDVAVRDVEFRVDGGPWSSVSSAARGVPSGAWALSLSGLVPGVHAVDVRALDGALASIPASLTVKVGSDRAPPSVALVEPRDGAGVAAGAPLSVSGTAVAEAGVARVVVLVNGAPAGAASLAGAGAAATAWSFVLPAGALASGVHEVSAVAFDARGGAEGESLPARARVAAASPGPAPAVRVLTPRDGEGVSANAPGPGCSPGGGACVVLAGSLEDPAAAASGVSVSVDGGPWTPVTVVGKLDRVAGAWRVEWPLGEAYAGEHEFRVRADGPGVASVPAVVRVNVASPRSLTVTAEPGLAAFTGTRVALVARWPDGSTALNASWTVDGAPREADGVGVLALNLSRPGDVDVVALAVDAAGRAARAPVTVAALNRPPVAVPRAPASASTNVTVVLDGSGSRDADGRVVAYRWERGDGTFSEWSSDAVDEHRFKRAGVFRVNLTVRDDWGNESAVASAVVLVGNSIPQAFFRVEPASGITVLSNVTLVDESHDPDGPPVARSWDLGDGASSSERILVHRFPSRGQFVVQLTVWDAAGAAATATRAIVVENAPPAPLFTWAPFHPRTGEVVRFQDLSRDADGAVARWRWGFGDGNESAARAPEFSWARPGNYTVVLQVTDDAGAVASVARTVVVGNAPPLARAAFEPESPRSFEEVRFTSASLDVDGRVASVHWNFGDGSSSNESSPRHMFTMPGEYPVTLTVTDDGGLTAVDELVVSVLNRPPDVAIARPLEFAYAGVPVTLEGAARDRDGVVRELRWVVAGRQRHWEYDVVSPEHVFDVPGVYRLSFMARDDAGDWGTAVRDLQVDVAPPGKHPPTVRVEFPQPNATFQGLVRFTGTAASVAPLERVELSFWKDGRVVSPFASPWVVASGLESWGFDFDAGVLPNGEYTLAVRVVDARGAVGEARVPVRVGNVDQGDVDLITLRVLSLAPGSRVEGVHVLRGAAYHPGGLASVRVRVDDGPWSDASGPPGSWAHAIDSLRLRNGAHHVTVRAYRSPAVYREEVVGFTVDNRPPVLLVAEAMPFNASGVVTVSGAFAPGSPPGEVFWRVDRGVWRPAAGNLTWRIVLDSRDLANGNHTLFVKAIGRHGLESPVVTYDFVARNVPKPDVVQRSLGAAERDVPAPGAWALAAVAALVALARRPHFPRPPERL